MLRTLSLIALLVGSLVFADSGGLQVHMGFMDEEVKFVLASLLKKYPNRKVMVLEREITADGMLFELPLPVYGQTPKRQKVSSFAKDDKSFEGRWANELRNSLDATALESSLDPKFKAKTKGAKEAFEILTFNERASDELPPIILVRSPEMGLQPSRVKVFLRQIYRSLARLGEASPKKGGLHVSVFGTSGAVGSHLAPGTLNRVSGSIYVGTEVYNRGNGQVEYQAVVQLADSSGGPVKTFYRSKPFSDRKEAEAEAKKVFNDNSSHRLTVDGNPLGQTLAEAVSEIQATRGGSVSLTVSFFGGDEEKEAGRRLGLTNVNMEDFHVLTGFAELLSDRARGTLNVTRFNCDPPKIPARVINTMEDWGKKTAYTKDHYVDAILWGLKGAQPNQAPSTARWSALDGIHDADSYAYRMPNGKILDPFYSEIASDFLLSTLRKEGLGPELFSKVFYERLSDQDKKALEGLLNQKKEKMADLARKIYGKFKVDFETGELTPAAEAALRKQVRELVDETESLEIPAGPLKKRILKSLIDAGPHAQEKRDFLNNAGRVRLLSQENREGQTDEPMMEVWVRSGKWKGNQAMTLDHLLSELALNDLKGLTGEDRAKKFQEMVFGDIFSRGVLDGANADRALYKTGLVGGLLYGSEEQVKVRDEFYSNLSDPKFFAGQFEKLKRKLREMKGELCLGN